MYRTLAALALGSLLWSVKSVFETDDQADLGGTSIEKARTNLGDTSNQGCPQGHIPTNFNCPLFPTIMSGSKTQWRLPSQKDADNEDGNNLRRERRFMICGMARPNVGQNPACGTYTNRRSSDGAISSILNAAKDRFHEQRRIIRAEKKHITLVSLDEHEIDAIHTAAIGLGFGHSEGHIFEDFTSPTPDNLETFVNRTLKNGPDEHFIVHCGGGMGRTGIFLVALYARLFQIEGVKVYKDYTLGHFQDAEVSERYTEWYEPLDEAALWVMFEYHGNAGEFLEVGKNYDALAKYMLKQRGTIGNEREANLRSWISDHKCDFLRYTTDLRVTNTGGRDEERVEAQRNLLALLKDAEC